MLYIGIDGGGTKTLCLVADAEGHILGKGDGGACNICTYPEEARRSVQQALQSALQGLQGTPHFAVIGCAGSFACSWPGGPEAVFEGIFPPQSYKVVSDQEIALIGATLGKPGCIVIAGTGSAAYGGNDRGERVRVGGWGYLLSDEGGAFWIALQALRAVLRAEDGRGPQTRLSQRLLEALGLSSPPEIEGYIYAVQPPVPRIAPLAPLVLATAEEGDSVAQTIAHQAGQELALLALSALRQLSLEHQPVPVCPIGGVFGQGSGLIYQCFREHLLKEAPQVKVVPPELPPAGGALLMAYQSAGVKVNLQKIGNIKTGLATR